MKCSECGNEEAVVLPVEAGDVESEWQCNRCEAHYSAKEMERKDVSMQFYPSTAKANCGDLF